MWRQKRNKDFGIDWDRINLIPFCVLHRIENTNHFSDWLKSFSLGLNRFFLPSFSLKIAICLFRWITKRKITTGERQDPRFLTRHAIRTGAHPQRVERNELCDGQHTLARRDKSLHNDQLTGRRPLLHTQSRDKIKQICNCPVIETSPLWAGNDKISSPATLHSSSPSTNAVFLFFHPSFVWLGKGSCFSFLLPPMWEKKERGLK